METLFDAGVFTKALPVIRLTSEYAEVMNTGNNGVVRMTTLQANVLNSGAAAAARLTAQYVEVLSAVLPASEINGDTNAGVNDDITEFDDGSGPPDPIFLGPIEFLDESTLDVTMNTNVSKYWLAKFTDDSTLTVRMTIPIRLAVEFVDESTLDMFSEALKQSTVTQTVVVMTGR
jgi:hypothetical protein